MSALQKDFMRSKLDKLPAEAPGSSDQVDGEDEDDEGFFDPNSLKAFQDFNAKSSARNVDAKSSLFSSPRGKSNEYSPLPASLHFKEALEVEVGKTVFRAYYSPPSQDGVLFVCHHGAGYSGLAFAAFAQTISSLDSKVGILAYDARGHGKTRSESREDDENLSLETLSSDLVAILKALFPEKTTAPKVVLVGHSMGGAVVTSACNTLQAEVCQISGVAVLDVVEEIAIQALDHMQNVIDSRPKGFPSLETAVSWHIKSHTLRNLQSARLSVPSLLIPNPKPAPPPTALPPTAAPWASSDDDEMEEMEELSIPNSTPNGQYFEYIWRADLNAGRPFWRGWFEGLSTRFLNCKAPKILVLAGTDRLDKELMVAQMQGKYQLAVFPGVGHCLHEDDPERLARTLLEFVRRNSLSQEDILKKVKKVGQK